MSSVKTWLTEPAGVVRMDRHDDGVMDGLNESFDKPNVGQSWTNLFHTIIGLFWRHVLENLPEAHDWVNKYSFVTCCTCRKLTNCKVMGEHLVLTQ